MIIELDSSLCKTYSLDDLRKSHGMSLGTELDLETGHFSIPANYPRTQIRPRATPSRIIQRKR
ncbi:hypothetical protein ES702_07231 [subsurface metagenome]